MNAATLTSNATDRVHDKVESLRSSLESNIDPITAREKQLEAICKTLDSRRNELSTADVASRLPVCGRLLGAAPAFHQKYSAVSDELSHLELVYRREEAAQRTLITSGAVSVAK
jgi:hypothetical protein